MSRHGGRPPGRGGSARRPPKPNSGSPRVGGTGKGTSHGGSGSATRSFILIAVGIFGVPTLIALAAVGYVVHGHLS